MHRCKIQDGRKSATGQRLKSSLKYKKYLIWPIKYIKHYKSTEYMKRTILSINMIGNEKQKTWQKNTIFTSKMLKGLCSAIFKSSAKVGTKIEKFHQIYQICIMSPNIIPNILEPYKLSHPFFIYITCISKLQPK